MAEQTVRLWRYRQCWVGSAVCPVSQRVNGYHPVREVRSGYWSPVDRSVLELGQSVLTIVIAWPTQSSSDRGRSRTRYDAEVQGRRKVTCRGQLLFHPHNVGAIRVLYCAFRRRQFHCDTACAATVSLSLGRIWVSVLLVGSLAAKNEWRCEYHPPSTQPPPCCVTRAQSRGSAWWGDWRIGPRGLCYSGKCRRSSTKANRKEKHRRHYSWESSRCPVDQGKACRSIS